MSGKRNTLSIQAIEGQLMPEELTYQAKLRSACFDAVSEADVAEVVKSIVTKSKEGNPAAQKLFFDYLLGHKSKATTIEVHNHFPNLESASHAEKALRGLNGNCHTALS